MLDEANEIVSPSDAPQAGRSSELRSMPSLKAMTNAVKTERGTV